MESTHDLTNLTETELKEQLGAAVLDGSDERLYELEHERDRRRSTAERQQLADAEAQRRAKITEETERDALLAKLSTRLAEFEQQHRDDLAELERTPQAETLAVVERAYISGRQAYSIAHDLFGATGDRRFYRAYRVPDALSLHGGRAGDTFLMQIRGRPPKVETPWSVDIARLRELMPRVKRIGNGG